MKSGGVQVVVMSLLAVILSLPLSTLRAEEQATRVQVPGLNEAVEILADRWGIAHIYARNQDDLFFAQGYNAARDRLFQLEIWRRRVTGTMAEIQGPKALDRDIGARLLRPRGDLRLDMYHYHPQGEQIITGSSPNSCRLNSGCSASSPKPGPRTSWCLAWVGFF